MTAQIRRGALRVLIAMMFFAPCMAWAQCVVPDNGSGTVTLPPAGCAYLSPADVHRIIAGLPPGTTIELGVQHERFFCPPASPVCTFPPPAPGDCVQTGGGLGGDQECASSQLTLKLKGTGSLAGWMRVIPLQVGMETHTGPRTPGNPVQSFDTDMFRLSGQIANPGAGDPDFDLLRITAGTSFGLPSPGHTTLTQLAPGGPWNVDSFFDITYRIDYVGRTGGALSGMSGSTTGTIRMATGNGPSGGQCMHGAADCDDLDACTTDVCQIDVCEELDNGTGTVTLPPIGCGYVSPEEVHAIIDGLPPGTELNVGIQHAGFNLTASGPGGSLGGEIEQFDSMLHMSITGTGVMSGYSRDVSMQVASETHIGPRTPGMPVQSFPTIMNRIQGQIPAGDPDFDLLRITAGNAFGMPSPGHTTLTQQPGGTWAVDSFFDVFYRIDFVGRPGGPFTGMSGSTTGTIRMHASGGGTCVNTPVDCDDNNSCTADSCNPATGRCENDPVICDDGDPCTLDGCVPSFGPDCDVPDNGTGTATLPPAGCGYVSPADLHEIIDGLPPGTTIQVAATHKDFICPAASPVCSFPLPMPGSDCDEPGGSLNGEKECAGSTLALEMTGTGVLAGFHRTIDVEIGFETHTAPRTPGMPVQSFDTDMFRLFGQITNPGSGDPDFDLLRIVGGTDFGLPSPGHTTLVQQPGGYAVDSFFDITYRIDFVGRPGGSLSGMSGSTTGTIRMLTGDGGCVHQPVDCDDGDGCTADSCNPLTGLCEHTPVPCDDGDPCTADSCLSLGAPDCTVPDNGGGTATLPPAGCGYVSPADVHEIIDGLPAGTTIELAVEHRSFFCGGVNPICSFQTLPGDCDQPGGVLGGEKECAESTLAMNLTGTGLLAGFNRQIMLPSSFETHTAPRTPATSPQSFDTQMFRLFGQITNPGAGDPDFDLLRIVAGTDFGLPSPGHTTLTQSGPNWAVDSFFDITYRIDFVGKPGGALAGMSGSTTGTIRMAVGDGGCISNPIVCDDSNPCTVDRCNPSTGQCEFTPVVCDDGDPCTADSCNPLAGGCVYTPIPCDDGDPCTADSCVSLGAPDCTVPDNGGGTVTLPPAGCGYVSPADVHEIIDGLPPGTTIQVAAEHKNFFCGGGINPVCSFQPPAPGDCDEAGGSLGGEKECAQSMLSLNLTGTGMLAGFMRTLDLPIGFETHTAPRMPGTSPQAFDTDMFRLFGQITNPGSGDPDFDLLRIVAGTDFGMPSPGHTTLTQLPGGQWAVDSFFDIEYRIDFVGKPGSPLQGMSGSTTATIRMAVGDGGCINTPICDDGDPCTTDTCNPDTGGCEFTPVVCDDSNLCTADRCNPLTGQCEYIPAVDCDDGDSCTADSCNPLTGLCEHMPVPCDDGDPCTTDTCVSLGAPDCTVPDNGGGTATLPPAGCGYVSPAEVHEIIDGLPAGTTIELAVEHRGFFCGGVNPICSFQTLPGDCDQPGGVLGGEKECAESTLAMNLTGTGLLAGFNRQIMLPSSFETHTAPRTPATSPQSFDTQMFRLFGQITNPGAGDPDFDLLRIVAGTDFGLPSPGHTTLTQSGPNWAVDSFFDITYRIDFVGRPGGALSGMSGSTTGTIRMAVGDGGCLHSPTVCDDGNPCTVDTCNALSGGCDFTPVVCDDGIACTVDSCNPANGLCEFVPGPPAPPIGFTMMFPNPTQLNWAAVPGATHWNVYRGLMNVVGPPFYNHQCYVSGAIAPSIPEPMNPPLHQVFYYLVSQENQCGESGLGTSSSMVLRPIGLACPTPP